MSAPIAIIIPARFASTRFPGKPLAMLGSKPMLQHVYDNAVSAAEGLNQISIHVATDDERIAAFCKNNGMNFIMTSPECHTGTDRVFEAVSKLPQKPEFILNMQGDAPFTPPDFMRAMIDAYLNDNNIDMCTPVTKLTWDELDKLRESKKTTPFSGTTVIVGKNNNALWFSKNIIPAIRKEEELRQHSPLSPVFRHIGLYGYTFECLKNYVEWPAAEYEELEGLEQLRALENGLTIRAVPVDYKGRPGMSGIDSPEDLERAQLLLQKQ